MKYTDKKPISGKTLRIGLLLAGWLVIASCYADINVQTMAYMCRNCHEPASTDPVVPALDSLTALQIQKMLLDFKYDKQVATLMPRIAKGYNDQELQALADYLGKH